MESYEGTGRSLSLKLLQQLEEQSHASSKNGEGTASGTYATDFFGFNLYKQYTYHVLFKMDRQSKWVMT